MRGHADIIRAIQREPRREFSTTQLVDAIYPRELRSAREQHEYGTKEQKHKAQALKSALHRKALYHIGRLVESGVLRIERLDAHGEKIYSVMPNVHAVDTTAGSMAIERPELNAGVLLDDLRARTAFLYEEHSALTRYNAVYIDASRLDGFGQLLRLTELASKVSNDVVAIGNMHAYKRITEHEDTIKDFLSALAVLTLDEGRRCVLCLETRGEDCLPFVRALTALAPKRVSIILVVDGKSLQQQSTHTAIELLRERIEKVTIHYTPNRDAPVFTGRAGPYSFSAEHYASFRAQRSTPLTIITAASVCLDLERLERMPSHEIRETFMRAATGLFSIAAQQRLVGTGSATLQAISADPASIVRDASIALRLWNYDWEKLSPVIASVRDMLVETNKRHASVYRACGLAIHPSIQLSSAFPKFHPELSGRTYRKWTVSDPSDLTTSAFVRYRDARLAVAAAFDDVDRFRVFRSGQPTGREIASELNTLGAAGFALITYDFKPLVGVRRLTEFFGENAQP